MGEMTEIKQQDHDDVFYHKRYVGDQSHSSKTFNLTVFCFVVSYYH